MPYNLLYRNKNKKKKLTLVSKSFLLFLSIVELGLGLVNFKHQVLIKINIV